MSKRRPPPRNTPDTLSAFCLLPEAERQAAAIEALLATGRVVRGDELKVCTKCDFSARADGDEANTKAQHATVGQEGEPSLGAPTFSA